MPLDVLLQPLSFTARAAAGSLGAAPPGGSRPAPRRCRPGTRSPAPARGGAGELRAWQDPLLLFRTTANRGDLTPGGGSRRRQRGRQPELTVEV